VRLARRGLTLTAGGLAAALAESAPAAVPPVLLALSLRAAVSFAASGSISGAASSAQAVALAKGALQTMSTTKLLHGIVLLLAVGVTVFGAALGTSVGREAVPGTRAESIETGGQGRTLAVAAHPDERTGRPEPVPGDPTKARGLELTLGATKKEYSRGEPVDLILTIKNHSKKEFSYLQYKLQDLCGFGLSGPDGKDVKPASNPVEIEFAGTLVSVRPGEATTLKEPLRGINLPKAGTDHYLRHRYYPIEAAGTYRLRIKVGEATSNELVLKVLADEFGPEVKGLRAKVTLAKEKFEAGEAIPVKYVVKNVSRGEQIVWHSGFWSNHLILVHDAGGKEPPLTPFGQQRRQAFSPGGERGKNSPWTVSAGGEDTAYEQYDLAKLYDLSRPGRYTVQYVYEEKQGGWEGRLPSNKAAFEVVAKRDKKGDGTDPTKGVRVEGLEFVALVPDRVSKPLPGTSRDVDLGLRVTNVSGKPLAIRTFDVIRPRLYTADRREVGIDIGRHVLPKPTPPALLAPGASWTWQPRAALSWTTDRATLRLSGPDGRGVAGVWYFTTLKEGKYHLAIEYTNDPKQCDVSLWVGKATTNEVAFEIVAQVDALAKPPEQAASEPQLKLEALVPAKAPVVGEEINLEVVLSTDSDQTYEFQFARFPQEFGIYLLGPWGTIESDRGLGAGEKWFYADGAQPTRYTVTKGKPFRATVRLSDYFPTKDTKQFKAGVYQVNVKFYDDSLKLSAPLDSGPVRFELAPKK
jgi:hypothetical protein